jgi:hypothetical protein
MSDIAELEIEVLRIQDELSDARLRLREAKIAASGVAIGDIVVGNKSGNSYRVTHIDTSWTPPWLKGNPMRKDGTFGTAQRSLFDDWKKP